MSFCEMLTKLMEDHGTSNVSLGKAIGVSDMAVARWKKQEAVPSLDNAIAVANYYNISMDELTGVNEKVVSSKYVRVPVIGSLSIWSVYTYELWAEEYITIPRDTLCEYPQEECYAMRVRDTSLGEEYIPDLSYIIFHQQSQCENEDYVLIKESKKEEIMFTKFCYRGQTIELQSPGIKPIIYKKQNINQLRVYAVAIGNYIAV